MGFDASEKPNPKYFDYDLKKKDYVLRPGLVADAAHKRVYRLGDTGSDTGCKRAAQTLMLEGLAKLAESLGKAAGFDKAVAGSSLSELFPEQASSPYQGYSGNPSGLDPKTFVPGDRVRMDDHKFVPGVDAKGFEGSNVIYAGNASDGTPLFVHMDGAKVETLSQMRQTVRGYSAKAGGTRTFSTTSSKPLQPQDSALLGVIRSV